MRSLPCEDIPAKFIGLKVATSSADMARVFGVPLAACKVAKSGS
jgi:hypothetical protein